MTHDAQELIRPLPVVLRPRPDELLSSWLTRHAAYYGVTRRRLLDHVGILSPSVEALDREITLGQQIMLAGYFHRQAFEIAAMSYEPRNGSCNLQDTHNILNDKAFAPSFANAEQLAPPQQFQ